MFESVYTQWGNLSSGDRILLPNSQGHPVMHLVTGHKIVTNPATLTHGEDAWYIANYDLMNLEDSSERTVAVDFEKWFVVKIVTVK